MLAYPFPLEAEPSRPAAAQRRMLVLDAGLSGSWEDEDDELWNRADLQISAFGTTLRAMATDVRNTEKGFDEGMTDFACGVYHAPTASRVLLGPLEQTGLSRRISSPFDRSVPLADDRRAGEVDIDPDAPIGREPSLHAAIGTPRRLPLRAHASTVIESDENYVLSATAEAAGGRSSYVRMEGAYARRELSERSADAWFSEMPPLPDRLLRVYAAGTVLSSPSAAIAVDAALSDTYAEGAGMYGNAALRLGDAPWRLSVAADAASPRYIGPDGDTTGLGFRSLSRIERATVRRAGSLFRADFRTTHPYVGSAWDGFEAALSLRLRESAARIRLKRTMISGEWSVTEGEPLIDAALADVGMAFGPIDMATSLRTTFEPSDEGLGGRLWNSSTLHIYLAAEIGPVDLRAGAGRTLEEDHEDTTEAAFGASISLRRTAFGLRLDFEEVPGPPSIKLSWRTRCRSLIPFPIGGTP